MSQSRIPRIRHAHSSGLSAGQISFSTIASRNPACASRRRTTGRFSAWYESANYRSGLGVWPTTGFQGLVETIPRFPSPKLQRSTSSARRNPPINRTEGCRFGSRGSYLEKRGCSTKSRRVLRRLLRMAGAASASRSGVLLHRPVRLVRHSSGRPMNRPRMQRRQLGGSVSWTCENKDGAETRGHPHTDGRHPEEPR